MRLDKTIDWLEDVSSKLSKLTESVAIKELLTEFSDETLREIFRDESRKQHGKLRNKIDLIIYLVGITLICQIGIIMLILGYLLKI